jgi:hypothetical protein
MSFSDRPTFIADGNISPSVFVTLAGTGKNLKVVEATANSKIIGVSQEGTRRAPGTAADDGFAAIAGETLTVHLPGEICLLEADAAVVPGAYLESAADGQGLTAVTTAATVRQIGAIALEDASAAGEKIKVLVNIFTQTNPA